MIFSCLNGIALNYMQGVQIKQYLFSFSMHPSISDAVIMFFTTIKTCNSCISASLSAYIGLNSAKLYMQNV